jgi:hypothetical protein
MSSHQGSKELARALQRIINEARHAVASLEPEPHPSNRLLRCAKMATPIPAWMLRVSRPDERPNGGTWVLLDEFHKFWLPERRDKPACSRE